MFSNNSFSQTGWIHQNSGSISSLTGISFLDSDLGFICGYNGTILKTSNSGLNWENFPVGLNVNYTFSIKFFNQDTGFIIAELNSSRRILKTTNGSINWNSSGSHSVLMMYFLNSTTGWSGWNNIYKTIDAGNNWIYMGNLTTSTTINNIWFVNENTGFASGTYYQSINPEISLTAGRILKTTNSGSDWNIVFITGLDRNYASDIFFVNETSGFALGTNGFNPAQSYLFSTSNAGSSWTQTIRPTGMSFLHFIDDQTGWIGGQQGNLYYTSNAGINWIQQLSNINDQLLDIEMLDQNTGWIVGISGLILKTTNGGTTWINTVSTEVPNEFKLSQNYPNPFNPVTKIGFDVQKTSLMKLKIFNLLGKEVSELVNGQLNPGKYEVSFDAGNYESGIYFYRLETENFSQTKRMILLK
ncbi:MAG: T9SS type A sorting domain-containing protein [Ignavibacteria bacterium]